MWKIIIAEDNDMVRESICRNIDWSELEAEVAGDFQDGQSAWEYICREPVDVVLTDIIMPFMSGIDLAQNIFMAELPAKVILLSSYNEFEYAKNAIRFGVSAYITKPIDYEALKENVKAALQEIEELRWIREKLEKSLPVIRNQFFNRLLQNKVNKKSFESDSRYLNLHFRQGPYQCYLLEMDCPCEDLEMQKKEIALYTMEDLTKRKIRQLIEDATVFIYQNEQVVVFAGISDSTGELYEAFEWVRQQLHQRIGISVSVGIGSAVPQILHIGRSYDTAVEALKLRFLEGGDKIFDVRNVSIGSGDIHGFVALSEQEFCDRIKFSRMEEIREMLLSLKEALIEREAAYRSAASWLKYYGGYLFRLWYEIEGDESNATRKYSLLINDLTHQKTFEEGFRIFSDQVITLYEEMNKARGRKKGMVIEQVKEYIHLHYKEKELSLEDLAQKVFLSSSYLSTLFKKSTDQTITNYITNMRIAQAKQLLAESDRKISEIAEDLGYVNQFYFSSCFKKIVGVAPQEFRNSAVREEL